MEIVKDRSYGIVPVRYREGEWEFALVQHLGGHWSFPKGHPEGQESPKEAALRELKEETDLNIETFFDRYPFKEEFRFRHAGKQIDKTVMYYLALVNGEIKRQEEELLDTEWLDFEEAMERLTYPRAVEICRLSYEYLSTLKNPENYGES